ncbi:MAG TPA: MFS transporter, partial [Pyrinomonadaceae bacterium]|nr:MFS transporter [Pyrinomonadaceae bacterium]
MSSGGISDTQRDIKLPKASLAALYTIFLLSGTATVLIGQILPVLSSLHLLDDFRAALFFPFQFTGSVTGTVLAGFFSKRGKLIQTIKLGSILMAGGILLLSGSHYLLVAIGFAANGVGIGLTLASINLLIFNLSQENASSSLSFLNFFWGAGAILAKPFVDLTAVGNQLWLPCYLLSFGIFASVAVWHLTTPGIRPGISNRLIPSKRASFRNPLVLFIILFNFFHVGFESGIGGWLTTYSERLEAKSGFQLFTPIFCYFLLFVGGRAFAAYLLRIVEENILVFIGIALILLGVALILAAGSVYTVTLGAAIAGFGTSWIFPINLARYGKALGDDVNNAIMPFFLAGTAGAASTTFLIGSVSDL